MEIEITPVSIIFRHSGQVAGEYRLDDPFKPHFDRLLTPTGHQTVLAAPGDHPHHKGLMYALRCEDLNFWEEQPETGTCGQQTVLRTESIKGGIHQSLRWEAIGGSLATYHEERKITAKRRPDGQAFVWKWRSSREALRDHCLIQSEWSTTLPSGRRINYHGLGARLPWMWRYPGKWAGGVEVDGKPSEPADACGASARAVGFWGLVDGQPSGTRAALTMRQEHDFSWFVLKADFPYLATGPTVAGPLAVRAGTRFEETYTIIVEDRASA